MTIVNIKCQLFLLLIDDGVCVCVCCIQSFAIESSSSICGGWMEWAPQAIAITIN